MPVAHHDGAYVAGPGGVEALLQGRQVLLRYVSPEGKDDPAYNFNCAEHAIAGIAKKRYRIRAGCDIFRGAEAGKRLVGTREMGDAVLAKLEKLG